MANKEVKVTGGVVTGSIKTIDPIKSASVQYSPGITVKIEHLGVHTSGLYKRGLSTATVDPVLLLTVTKPLTETLEATSNYSADLLKPLVEERTLEDAFGMVWDAHRFLSTEYVENGYTADSPYTQTTPLTEDLTWLSLGKTLLDQRSAIAALTLEVAHPQISVQAVSDSITTAHRFYRSFTATVDSTDDILGEASTDDDQTLWLSKGLVETSITADGLVWESNKHLTSEPETVEMLGKAVTPAVKQDSASTADSTALLWDAHLFLSTDRSAEGPYTAESPFIEDTTWWSLARQLGDTASASSSLNLFFDAERSFASTGTSRSSQTLAAGKALVSTGGTEAELSRIWDASLRITGDYWAEDYIEAPLNYAFEALETQSTATLGMALAPILESAVSDTLLHWQLAPVLLETITSNSLLDYDLAMPLADIASADLALAWELSSVLTDSASQTSSGLINLQNYSYSDYVAVGYLGTEQTF